MSLRHPRVRAAGLAGRSRSRQREVSQVVCYTLHIGELARFIELMLRRACLHSDVMGVMHVLSMRQMLATKEAGRVLRYVSRRCIHDLATRSTMLVKLCSSLDKAMSPNSRIVLRKVLELHLSKYKLVLKLSL